MEKIFYRTLLIVLIGCILPKVLNAADNELKFQQETSNTLLPIGYCGTTMYSSFGASAGSTVNAGILLPTTMTKNYIGTQLTKLRIGVGNTTITSAQIFLSYDKNSTPFYSQSVMLTPSGWNEVTLTTPYTIENKDLFVYYSVVTGTSAYHPVGVDQGPALTNGDYFGYVTSTGTASGWMTLQGLGYSYNVCLQAVLEGATLPHNDVDVVQMDIPKYVKAGTKYVLSGKIKNMALDTIQSIQLTAQYEENKVDTFTITGLHIASAVTGTFTTDSIVANHEGIFDMTAGIIRINGAEDEDVSTNFVTKPFNVYASSFKRKVILEHFTTAKCVNCPSAQVRIDDALTNRTDMIEVAHHAGYLTDNFTIAESKSYLWFFNTTSTYAPAIMLDRTNLYEYSVSDATTDSPVFYPYLVTQLNSIFDVKTSQPAFVSVNVTNDYNETTRQLTITVSGEKNKYFSALLAPRMNIYLTEDSLILAQTGSIDPNYRHDNVMRDVVSALWGDLITFAADSTYSMTYTYSLPAEWTARRMHVVAFVGDYDATNTNLCEIYNAESMPVIKIVSGVKTIDGTSAFAVVQGQQVSMQNDFLSCKVYDITGKVVKTVSATERIFNLPYKGMFVLKIQTSEGDFTQKIVLK